MQTVEQQKDALVKQLQRGIWAFPWERFDEIVARVNACQTEADVDAWRAWMVVEFPENAME